MCRNQEIVIPGCQAIYYFLKRNGRSQEAVAYRQQLERARELREPTYRPTIQYPISTQPRTVPAVAQALRPEKTVKMDSTDKMPF